MWRRFSWFVFDSLASLLRERGHFNSAAARRRLPNVTIRRYQPADFNACVEIFVLNEPGRFPQNGLPFFKKCLQAHDQFTIVAEEAGTVLGCGSLSYSEGYMKGGTAILAFGLVHPEHHTRGIGTVMLLARLAQLRHKPRKCPVMIFSVPASFMFFRRFGFIDVGNWLTEKAITYPMGVLFMTPCSIKRCGQILTKAGISYPYEPDLVPLRKIPEEVELEK